MVRRFLLDDLQSALADAPAVVLLGPRQVGKTTLPSNWAGTLRRYTSTWSPSPTAPGFRSLTLYLERSKVLVVLDEIQRTPTCSVAARLIDRGGGVACRRDGSSSGSASLDLLRQSSESLAGRITPRTLDHHRARSWSRPTGRALAPRRFPTACWRRRPPAPVAPGFHPHVPRARHSPARVTHSSRDPAPALDDAGAPAGRRAQRSTACPGARRERQDGGELSGPARRPPSRAPPPAVAPQRRQAPREVSQGLRPRQWPRPRTPRHCRFGRAPRPPGRRDMPGRASSSSRSSPARHVTGRSAFYRTSAGAEVDLVLMPPGAAPWAIEVKRSASPRLERGFHTACDDIAPAQRFVVYPGRDRFPLPGGAEAIDLVALCGILREHAT